MHTGMHGCGRTVMPTLDSTVGMARIAVGTAIAHEAVDAA